MGNHSNTNIFPALSDHRGLRFFIVFMLYVAQGAPIGIFFFAIPAWLAANGAGALEVGGYLSATSLPWTLKFVNGFLVDRFTFLPMGRRKIWLIGAQAAMVFLLVMFAIANPGASNIAALSGFSFGLMIATTYQDVAVDGLAVDLIPDDERARANGFMFGGQSIGIAAGAAFTGSAIVTIGFTAAMLSNAGFIAAVLFLIVLVRERPGERLLPWTRGSISKQSAQVQLKAWKPLYVQIWSSMISRDCAYHVIAQISMGAVYGFFIGVMPLIAMNMGGWTDAGFSTLSGLANLVAGALGVCVFGYMADKIGSRITTIAGACVLSTLTGVFWLFKPVWDASLTIQTATIILASVLIAVRVAICASAMRICSPKVAATQFTLFLALTNLGITASSAMLGPLEAIGGYDAILAALIVAGLTCAGAMYRCNEKVVEQRLMMENGVAIVS